MKAQRMVLILCVVLVLAGCGSTSATSGAPPEPNLLHVTRTKGLYLREIPPLDRTIRDAAAVQRLYAAALALPVARGIVHCPVDAELEYHLHFLHGTTLLQQMDLDATGCQFLRIKQTDVRETNPSFLSLVTKTIGIATLTP